MPSVRTCLYVLAQLRVSLGLRRISFLTAFTQYLFDSLHDWHLKILLVAAIIGHLAHIFFEGLQIKDAVVAFGIVITAEPRGDEPRLTDFVMLMIRTVSHQAQENRQ